jgi:hypothetical protein
VDGIYPKHSIFITTFQHPQDEKEKYFAMCQEACKKDIKQEGFWLFGSTISDFTVSN